MGYISQAHLMTVLEDTRELLTEEGEELLDLIVMAVKQIPSVDDDPTNLRLKNEAESWKRRAEELEAYKEDTDTIADLEQHTEGLIAKVNSLNTKLEKERAHVALLQKQKAEEPNLAAELDKAKIQIEIYQGIVPALTRSNEMLREFLEYVR